MQKILLVAEQKQADALCAELHGKEYEPITVAGGKAVADLLAESRFAALLVDADIMGKEAGRVLSAAHSTDPDLVSLGLVRGGDIQAALELMRAGAAGLISKPIDIELAMLTLSRALETRRLRIDNATLQKEAALHSAATEAANKELDAFSYSVSHDLRAPLRAIRGFSQVLLEDYAAHLPEDVSRLLQRVSTGANRMNRLLEDLLKFARLGRHHISVKKVNMLSLAREVLAELQHEYSSRAVETHVDELPEIRGDQALLRQVLINLLSNAHKFTRPQTTPRIDVGYRRTGDSVVYFVRDNGVGFDMSQVDRLFGAFQRLHGDEFEGTGIGLVIVQRIVNRHGGKAWAEAAMNEGATFYFELPLKKEPA